MGRPAVKLLLGLLALTSLHVHPARAWRSKSAESLFESAKIGNCWDTNNGVTNAKGWGCDFYSKAMCGMYDGGGFRSNEMCCVCGGGWKEDSHTGSQACEASCYGQTCQALIEANTANTCASLESDYGCDCSGCKCTVECPATCQGYSCDAWIDSDHGLTCGLLESVYGCDCAGCGCRAVRRGLHDGYEDVGAGDCMKHCVNCDHSWHRYDSAEQCRVKCDEATDRWCYGFDYNEFTKCNLYFEPIDEERGDPGGGSRCYKKLISPSSEYSATEYQEGTTSEQVMDSVEAEKRVPEEKVLEELPEVPIRLGLVNMEYFQTFVMTGKMEFRITDWFQDPSGCQTGSNQCQAKTFTEAKSILTCTASSVSAYSATKVVFGGGAFGPVEHYEMFKPAILAIKTTWRVAKADDTGKVLFTIQKIDGDDDCEGGSKKWPAWQVFQGRSRDSKVLYYATQRAASFRFYRSRATCAADKDAWAATATKEVPTKANGQAVLSVTVRPGEDAALLMLASSAAHKSGDVPGARH